MKRRIFFKLHLGILLFPTQGLEDFITHKTRRFLFIGDSITDGNRGRNDDPNHILGHGFVFSIASRLGAKYPLKGLSFVNKGISGDTTFDLLQRWESDVIAQQPDLLTILIGINDFNKYISTGDEKYSPKSYEENLKTLLLQSRQQNSGLILSILSPFLIPMNKGYGKQYLSHRPLFELYHQASKNIAAQLGAHFIDLQALFLDHDQPTLDYWIWDGIHPTYSGHELITKAWFKKMKKYC